MSERSLLDLPVEILHHIFDYLHIKTIFCSLRCTCTQLHATVQTYKNFQLDLSASTSTVQFQYISQLFHPERITGLIFFAEINQHSNRAKLFFASFPIYQFTRLRSIALLNISIDDLNEFLQCASVLLVTSLSIHLANPYFHRSLPLLTSLINQGNLRRLQIINMYYVLQPLLWSTHCKLTYLAIFKCTFEELFIILGRCSFLRTFVLQDCTMYNADVANFHSCPQLTSLHITDAYLSWKSLRHLLSSTPSLVDLKVISCVRYFDAESESFSWEELIQTRLPSLTHFHFFFRYDIQMFSNNYMSLHSIIKQFRSPFWLEDKQWFVTCDFVLNALSSSEIILYTIPQPIYGAKIFIRCHARSTDSICYFTKDLFEQDENDDLLELNLANMRTRSTNIQLLACALQHNTTVAILNLDGNQINSDGIRHLADVLKDNTTIQTLSLNGNIIGDVGAQYLAEMLQSNNTLTTLRICGNQIGDEGIRYLSSSLQTNTTLTSLDISGNRIENEGVRHLADAFKKNKMLTTLSFQDNYWKDEGIQHLCQALRKNTTILTIDLRSNQIVPSSSQHLSDMLETNTTLTTLILADNELESKGIELLACGLRKNTVISALRVLNLRFNRIDVDGAEHLADVLIYNTSLTTLSLWNNQIKDTGARCLADALKQNKTLIALDLGRNFIAVTGARYLADMLRINTTLTSLGLWSNEIKEKGVHYLVQALSSNETLTTLDIGSNPIGDNGEQYLIELSKTNKLLTTLNFNDNLVDII
ncbi:unnamed protein product [Adineta ricciae]|uniref:F-box domain-containing protein n=1 Tax=Adineta ricciae TaxID=249248 RepID=A0A814NGX5_ADIRI|nr:unnamed protein product [Adineta ricciae]